MAKGTGNRVRSAATPEYGVHLIVSGTALIAQAEERISWHEQNAALAEKELADLKPIADSAHGETWRQQSRVNDLQRRADSHHEYARFLSFFKRHVVPKRRYRLGLSDMQVLEITPRGLYV